MRTALKDLRRVARHPSTSRALGSFSKGNKPFFFSSPWEIDKNGFEMWLKNKNIGLALSLRGAIEAEGLGSWEDSVTLARNRAHHWLTGNWYRLRVSESNRKRWSLERISSVSSMDRSNERRKKKLFQALLSSFIFICRDYNQRRSRLFAVSSARRIQADSKRDLELLERELWSPSQVWRLPSSIIERL